MDLAVKIAAMTAVWNATEPIRAATMAELGTAGSAAQDQLNWSSGMPLSFRKHPLAWANITFVMIGYAIFIGIAFAMHRRLELVDIVNIWPVHVLLLLNLAVVTGRIKLDN